MNGETSSFLGAEWNDVSWMLLEQAKDREDLRRNVMAYFQYGCKAQRIIVKICG